MSSWKIQIKASTGQVAHIELIDKAGPLNEWQSVSKDAFLPERGTFTNQLKKVVPTVQPSWILNNIDIDEINVGTEGEGEVIDNDGTFPTGNIKWKIILKF